MVNSEKYTCQGHEVLCIGRLVFSLSEWKLKGQKTQKKQVTFTRPGSKLYWDCPRDPTLEKVEKGQHWSNSKTDHPFTRQSSWNSCISFTLQNTL